MSQAQTNNGWLGFDRWVKRLIAIGAMLGVLVTAIYAYSDIRHSDREQTHRISVLEDKAANRDKQLRELDRKITRILTILERDR